MKQWIIGQYISLAEVFGWKIPKWMHNALTPRQMDALLTAESELTEALKTDDPSDVKVPENLEYLIESRLKASTSVDQKRPSLFGYLVPVSAFAACALLGLYLINTPDWVEPVQNNPVDELINTVETPIQTVANMTKFNDPEKGDILLRPLSAEKARLSSDVTNALKYVAQGVVPDQYVEQVNFRLDKFNAEMSKPI